VTEKETSVKEAKQVVILRALVREEWEEGKGGKTGSPVLLDRTVMSSNLLLPLLPPRPDALLRQPRETEEQRKK
jgi:hypothetical protein